MVEVRTSFNPSPVVAFFVIDAQMDDQDRRRGGVRPTVYKERIVRPSASLRFLPISYFFLATLTETVEIAVDFPDLYTLKRISSLVYVIRTPPRRELKIFGRCYPHNFFIWPRTTTELLSNSLFGFASCSRKENLVRDIPAKVRAAIPNDKTPIKPPTQQKP